MEKKKRDLNIFQVRNGIANLKKYRRRCWDEGDHITISPRGIVKYIAKDKKYINYDPRWTTDGISEDWVEYTN